MSLPALQTIILCTSVACGLTASVTDARERRIPNWLSAGALLCGLGLHFLSGSWRELGSSVAALLICGVVFLLFYLAGGMGAGDVKLIAAEGALLGLSRVPALLIYTALCGGLLAIVIAAKNGRIRSTAFNVIEITSHHRRHGLARHPELNILNSDSLRLPYALPITAGVILTIWLQSLPGVAL
jgi:prepilin peptidase CpaA